MSQCSKNLRNRADAPPSSDHSGGSDISSDMSSDSSIISSVSSDSDSNSHCSNISNSNGDSNSDSCDSNGDCFLREPQRQPWCKSVFAPVLRSQAREKKAAKNFGSCEPESFCTNKVQKL